MLEIADNKPQHTLDCQAYVYKHLCNLYDKYYKTVYGKLDAVLIALKFNDTMREFIEIAQMDNGRYLKDYYERLIRNQV